MKIAYIEHIALSTDAHVYIHDDNFDTILSLNAGINTVNTPLNKNNSIWEILSAYRVTVCYVFGGNVVLSALDIWAEKNSNVINYKRASSREEQAQQRSYEYIKRHDFGGRCYSRKLQIKTPKHGSTNRHARLHLTSYYAIDGFFPSMTPAEISEAYGIPLNSTYWLHRLLYKFSKDIFDVTGLSLIGKNGKLNYLTLGGISKDFYLNFYAPNSSYPSLSYMIDFPQSPMTDLILREARLLPPPLLYLRRNQSFKHVFKYDKNSLFPYTELAAPALGNAVKVDLKEFNFNCLNDSKYEYIIVFKRLELTLLPNRAPVLHSPFEEYHGENKPYIDINQNYAIFGRLLQSWINHYKISDFEIDAVYRCRKYRDDAIKHFVYNLYNVKATADNIYHRKVAKNLLNFLHGKFAQLPYFETYEYKQDNGILTRQAIDITDKWKTSHFHFIRGAYIYALAQVVMLDELHLAYLNGFNPDDIIYIDTDCIVTPVNPDDMADNYNFKIDSKMLGAYKVEEEAEEFRAFCPKNYIRFVDGDIKLTCAGFDAEDIITNAMDISLDIFQAYQNIAYGKTKTGRFVYLKTLSGITYEWQDIFYNAMLADVMRPEFNAEKGEIEE